MVFQMEYSVKGYFNTVFTHLYAHMHTLIVQREKTLFLNFGYLIKYENFFADENFSIYGIYCMQYTRHTCSNRRND